MQNDGNSSNDGNINRFGTFRRSLKQINSFKNKFFRLPATPRLSRATKALGKGEETTSWNFERPSVSNNEPNFGPTGNLKVNEKPPKPFKEDNLYFSNNALSPNSLDKNSRSSKTLLVDYNHRQDQNLANRSKRNSNRISFPTFSPPNATEAEMIIQDHMRNLLTPEVPSGYYHYGFLPNTSYAPSGEIYDAQWQKDHYLKIDSETSSPSNSLISLANRLSARPRSVNNSIRKQNTLKPIYPLNGIFHSQSAKALQITHASGSRDISPLFSLFDVIADSDAEKPFLGREWVFKDLHQMVVNEQTQFTLIYGKSGSGKSSIIRQIIFQSLFFKNVVNGDTVDSGITIGSQSSLHSTLSSRNYEWFKAIGSRIVAYHNCRLYSAISCMLPEFVKNIASHLYVSSILNAYSEVVQQSNELMDLLLFGTHLLDIDPVDLCRKLICVPLSRITVPADECFIVAIDGLDEADFHRNENGESIAWLLKQVQNELPPWLRFILTSAAYPPLVDLKVRTIEIDDAEMDQRVKRDGRLLTDYRITISPRLEQKFRILQELDTNGDIVDELVTLSQGNHLYLQLILDLIEQDKIHLETCNISLLPTTLSQLYLLLLNIHYPIISQFNEITDILSILIASLKPLNFDQILKMLNSANEMVSAEDLKEKLEILQPFVLKLSNGCYVPIHPTFREWILKMSDQTDYAVDVRMGHILHSIACVRNNNCTPESIFELGHHLLKANPYKYLRKEIAVDLPKGKDCQIEWIKIAAASDSVLNKALIYDRNLYYPNSKVSRLLLLSGADPNASWPDGDTLLCKYSSIGNVSMIQLLLHYKADPNLPNSKNKKTPLMLAAKKNNFEVVKLLLKNGALLDFFDNENKSALIHAAETSGGQLIVNYLLEYIDKRGINMDKEIKLASETAAASGLIPTCEIFLKTKPGVIDLSRMLCAACTCGQTEIVQFLLSRGAFLTVDHFWNGKSALLCAIDSGSWDLVVSMLNSSKIDLNKEYITEEGWTPLIVACRHGHAGLAELLINRGANMDITDNNGQTAVMHAIMKYSTSTANLLIDHGCRINVKDRQGNGLIHLLAQFTNKFLIDKLLALGLSLEDKNNADLRAVEIAIYHNNGLAVDIFLRRGARLRTLTWKVAIESDVQFILVLIRKLLDDAAILLKRKHQKEAVQRFEYALEKCNELLGEESASNRSSVINNNLERQSISVIKPQLTHYKVQILIAMTNIKRKNNDLRAAIECASNGLLIANTDESKYELWICRAKCHFDGHDMEKARIDAKLAAQIKPENADVVNLLAVLNTP
uniref:Rolling pebbles n=1 Tax=Panagrolaimus sp. JU765 TaxID=591449 RepID=A0AC34Q306_9BILA